MVAIVTKPTLAEAFDIVWGAVREFHKTFNHPAPDTPTLQPVDRVEKRTSWIDSECAELQEAETIVDQADAYIDAIYFGLGGLVELGVRPGKLFEIVQGANMAKVQPDGTVAYHPDGKVKKPEGWVAPEPLLAAEVERQINQ